MLVRRQHELGGMHRKRERRNKGEDERLIPRVCGSAASARRGLTYRKALSKGLGDTEKTKRVCCPGRQVKGEWSAAGAEEGWPSE